MSANGVIGRSRRPCDYNRCLDGWYVDLPGTACPRCGRYADELGEGYLPAADAPWGAIPEHEAYLDSFKERGALVRGRVAYNAQPLRWEPVEACDTPRQVLVSRKAARASGKHTQVVGSLQEALEACDFLLKPEIVVVAGGAQLIRHAVLHPDTDELRLTLLNDKHEGDWYLPPHTVVPVLEPRPTQVLRFQSAKSLEPLPQRLVMSNDEIAAEVAAVVSYRLVSLTAGTTPGLHFSRWKRVRT